MSLKNKIFTTWQCLWHSLKALKWEKWWTIYQPESNDKNLDQLRTNWIIDVSGEREKEWEREAEAANKVKKDGLEIKNERQIKHEKNSWVCSNLKQTNQTKTQIYNIKTKK